MYVGRVQSLVLRSRVYVKLSVANQLSYYGVHLLNGMLIITFAKIWVVVMGG